MGVGVYSGKRADVQGGDEPGDMVAGIVRTGVAHGHTMYVHRLGKKLTWNLLVLVMNAIWTLSTAGVKHITPRVGRCVCVWCVGLCCSVCDVEVADG